MRVSVLVFACLLVLPVPGFGVTAKEVSAQLERLKDPNLSISQKGEVSRKIQAGGKDAIPALIGCRNDGTSIGEVPRTGGECVNRPANLPMPPQCERLMQTETLGQRCEALLYQILTPAYASPYETPHTSKAMPPQPFVVPDWPKWWEQYQGKTLDEIHQDARKLIDQFWLQDAKASLVWAGPESVGAASGRGAWEQQVGQRVELSGIAQNAKLGAVVQVDGRVIYVKGKDRWESAVVGTKVQVKGVLRKFEAPAAQQKDGAWSAGVGEASMAYSLEP